jgi:hypothetical protein
MFTSLIVGLLLMQGADARPIMISGTIAQVQMLNPAISISVAGIGPDLRRATYIVMGPAPNSLIRSGFKSEMLKVGETVTVEGFRKDADPLTIRSATITFADGRKLSLGQSVSGL